MTYLSFFFIILFIFFPLRANNVFIAKHFRFSLEHLWLFVIGLLCSDWSHDSACCCDWSTNSSGLS